MSGSTPLWQEKFSELLAMLPVYLSCDDFSACVTEEPELVRLLTKEISEMRATFDCDWTAGVLVPRPLNKEHLRYRLDYTLICLGAVQRCLE
jgi:hypothetical protein